MRRTATLAAIVFASALFGGAGRLAAPMVPFPVAQPAAAAPGDDEFITYAGANGRVWTGPITPLADSGGPLPVEVTAVFEWSNANQSFLFWFRGFPLEFNTLDSLAPNSYYFFQAPANVHFVIPGSAGYVPPSPAPSFTTDAGATGKLWAGGPLAPADLPGAVSAVFRWNNPSQNFQFWFRGFPDSFNTLPPALTAGEFYFLQSAGGTTVQVPVPAAPGSSAAAIDEAVANGTLPVLPNTSVGESATAYKLMAAFGDESLPDEFEGTAGEPDLVQISRQFATFSAEAQAIVKPFLLPPGAAGSWYEIQNGAPLNANGERTRTVQWNTISTPRVKVWWHVDRPQDADEAQVILDEVENVIWPTLTTLMGGVSAEPPSDEECGEYSGGDGKFDIYLVNPNALPDYAAFQGPCYPESTNGEPPLPSWTVVEVNSNLTQLRAIVAHEFMHAVQFTFDREFGVDAGWLAEATAEWAVDYVYPSSNVEHAFAPAFYNSLNSGGSIETYVEGSSTQYGAYVWFQFLTQHLNDDSIIREIYENTANMDAFDAMVLAVGGEQAMRELWHQFSLSSLNRGQAAFFQNADGLAISSGTDVPISPPHFNFTVPIELPSMGLSAWLMDTTQLDAWAKLRIVNGLHDVPDARVMLMFKRAGTWEAPFQLTEEFSRYCWSLAEGSIQEVALVVSNATFGSSGRSIEGEMRLEFNQIPCKIHVEVTATQDFEIDHPDRPVDRHWSITTEFDMQLEVGPDVRKYTYHSIPTGTYHWERMDGNCNPANTGGNFTITSQTTASTGYARLFINDLTHLYFVPVVGNPTAMNSLTVTCPWGVEQTFQPLFWLLPAAGKPVAQWEGQVLGSHTINDSQGNTTSIRTWSWIIEPK